MVAIAELTRAFALDPIGDDRYAAVHVPSAHGVVFGGQLLAQSLLAGQRGHDKAVKTLHTVFARAARPDDPLELTVTPVHAGRAFASSTVTAWQGGRPCTQSSVLLSSDDEEVVRHASAAPDGGGPLDATPTGEGNGAWEIRIAGGVDIADPDQVGPAELDVWTRFVGAPDDVVTSQALLAFASDGFLIGTAMRPHPGVGQAQAHVTLSTGVISHTITFHEPFSAGDWMRLVHRSPHAGRGRSYGTADVFDEAGRLIASFVQDSMIRPRPEARQDGL